MAEKKCNTLYLSYDGMTDSLGQSQVLPYLKGLSDEYSIHLISFEKPERLEQHKETILQICDAAGIIWHPLLYTKRPPVLSTIYDCRKLFRLTKKLDAQYHFKLVHCRSYISALVGLSMKRKKGTKFLFDMRGFWADERVDGGLWNLKNPLYKSVYSFFKRKEKQFLSESDTIISLTSAGKKEILSWNLPAVDTEKITVIPCCVNTELFDQNNVTNSQKELLVERLGISQTDYILGYVGTIGTWYMLPEMLDYFQILKQFKPHAKFLFVTAENPETILSMATKKKLQQDDFIIEKCLHKDVPTYISLFDHSVFFIRPTFSKKASSPTKQGELMAMGIPIVGNSGVGDTQKVILLYKSGEVVDIFDSLHYAKAIKAILRAEFDATKMRAGAVEFYGLSQGIQNYSAIYQKLING